MQLLQATQPTRSLTGSATWPAKTPATGPATPPESWPVHTSEVGLARAPAKTPETDSAIQPAHTSEHHPLLRHVRLEQISGVPEHFRHTGRIPTLRIRAATTLHRIDLAGPNRCELRVDGLRCVLLEPGSNPFDPPLVLRSGTLLSLFPVRNTIVPLSACAQLDGLEGNGGCS